MTLDPDSLSNDVLMALNEPDSLLYISAESVKELIVAYKKKRLGTKKMEDSRGNGEGYRRRVLRRNSPLEERAHGDSFKIENQRGDGSQRSFRSCNHITRYDGKHGSGI